MAEQSASASAQRELDVCQLAVCACAGGIGCSIATTPFDVVKVRQQAYSFQAVHSVAGTIVRNEGIAALWTGLRPALVMTLPGTTIYMVAYESLRDSISLTSASEWAALISGGLARAVSGICTAPIELVRTRAQASRDSADVQQLAKRNLTSLWRGMPASLARDVPFSCLYWTVYDGLKKRRGPELTPTTSMLVASAAAAIASVPTTPLDVVKTRIEVHSGVPQPFARMLRQIVTEEGLRALFTGVVPRVLKAVPSCAITIGVYEFGKAHLIARRQCTMKPFEACDQYG